MESLVNSMTPNLDLIFYLIVVSTFSRNTILIDQTGIFWSIPDR